MTFSAQNTSILCPLNDAESFAIIKIAKKLGFETRISLQNGGFTPLFREPLVTLADLKQNVITIEMPGPEEEKKIQEGDRQLKIIDHHHYASLGLNRDNAKSSLEQFAELISHPLSPYEKAIALNDQHYIYGLARAGYPLPMIKEIRLLDLSLQGYSESEFNQLEKVFSNNPEALKSGISIYRSDLMDKYSYLADLHVMKHDCVLTNFAITGPASGNKVQYIWFSGEMKILEKLFKLGGYGKKSNDDYGYWGGVFGGDRKSGF